MSDPVNSWITIDEVRVALDLGDDTTQDAKLGPIIDGVCRSIEDYIGRTVVAQVETAEMIDGDGTDVLLLKAPIVTLTTLINDDVTLTVGTDFVIYNTIGKVKLVASTFVEGPQTVSCTYRHGWESEKVPASLKSAALMWSIKRFQDIKNDRLGVTSKSFGDQTISYIGRMPDEVREAIEPYRIVI
jgi:hypothetical protein